MPAFRFWGVLGLFGAVVVAGSRDVSLAVEGAIVLAAILTFCALAMAMKILIGREALIYYHHEIAVLSVTAALAALLGAPVLDHLDATALGLGTFLAFGRVGCLFSGCCHGRPGRGGVRYDAAHPVPLYLLGLPLFPVQALEAALVALLVVVGALLSEPGAAFAFYVTGYAVARFGLEELRGDLWRPYRLGLSAAQWTSLAVASVMAALALAGALPGPGVHLAVVAALVVAALAVRRRTPALLATQHVHELSVLLPGLSPGRADVRQTSLGVRCSAGISDGHAHYTLSRPEGTLAADDAGALARVILWLRHPDDAGDLVAGAAGTYHLLIR
jgi:hypothetical protein